MKFLLVTSMLTVLFLDKVNAQVVTGQVQDETGKPIPQAAVALLQPKDSTLVKAELADGEGRFTIKGEAGGFLLQAAAAGRTSQTQTCTLTAGITTTVDFRLATAVVLQGVTVSAKKPFIEARPGMMVVNVENSAAAAGSNAFDLLKRSPGVQVEEEGNVSLRGQSVQVYVDGRPTRLSGPQLAALLKSMTAEEIAQLELITQPSSRYDAAGSGGIINIRTRSIRKQGIHGNFSASGTKATSLSGNLSGRITYRRNKLTLYASEYFNYVDNYNTLRVDRRYRANGGEEVTGNVLTEQKLRFNSRFHRVRIGGEYALDKNTTIGLRGAMPMGNPVMTYDNLTTVNDIPAASTIRTAGDRRMNNSWYEREAGLLARRKFRDESELSVDAFYVKNQSRDHGVFYNEDQNAAGTPIASPDVWALSFPVGIRLLSSQADYSRALDKKTRMEAGIKYTAVSIDYAADYRIPDANGVLVADTLRSTRFLYKEQVAAAYGTATRTVSDALEVQVGLRAEQTTGDGEVPKTGQTFHRSYLNLFPTVFAAWKVDSLNNLTVSYGRRLDRPNYYILNPARDYIDKYSYRVGNPALLPQFTNNLEVGYSYAGKLTATVSATQTSGVISDFFVQDDQTKTAYEVHDNIAGFRQCGLSVNYNGKIGKAWTINVYGDAYLREFTGSYFGKPYAVTGSAWTCNINNQFALGKGWNAELSGWYNGPSRNTVFTESKPMGSIDGGISKKVLHDSLTIKLAFQDVLGTQRYRGTNRFANFDTDVQSTWDARRAVLSLNYSFGRDIELMSRKGEGDRRM